MTALLYLGGILCIVGGIWLLVVAFKTSVWWGLGSLLIPVVGIVFAIMHWQAAKTPFLIYLVGVVMTVIGVMNSHEVSNAMSMPA